jgi:hypothetical protein
MHCLAADIHRGEPRGREDRMGRIIVLGEGADEVTLSRAGAPGEKDNRGLRCERSLRFRKDRVWENRHRFARFSPATGDRTSSREDPAAIRASKGGAAPRARLSAC